MRVLLVKPRPAAVQFGLAPFFQTEPLGLEYVASALIASGHQVRIVDLRFERRPRAYLAESQIPLAGSREEVRKWEEDGRRLAR